MRRSPSLKMWFPPMIDDLARGVRTPLLVLLGAVGCMLLIACLNLSNLLVARSARASQGGCRPRCLGGSRAGFLICEQMTESLLICLVGGGLGLLLSLASTDWLAAIGAICRAPTRCMWMVGSRVYRGPGGHHSIAGSSCARSLVHRQRATLGAARFSRSIGGSASRARLRKTMLTVEIALTVVLLVSAGLLFKSFLRLRMTDLGCRIDHVITMKFGLPEIQYDTRDKVVRFHQSLLERLRRLPGVRGAALVSVAPGSGFSGDRVFTILERPAPSYSLQYDAITLTADPQYFSVMQIPLAAGPRLHGTRAARATSHYVVVSKRSSISTSRR